MKWLYFKDGELIDLLRTCESFERENGWKLMIHQELISELKHRGRKLVPNNRMEIT